MRSQSRLFKKLLRFSAGLACGLILFYSWRNVPSTSWSADEGPVVVVEDSRPRREPDFDPKEKYFVYQPSGGWGNQRLILKWAMRAANAMDRILVLPMVSPHTSMWWNRYNLKRVEMVPMDMVLDIEHLKTGLVKKKVLVLDETLASFHARFRKHGWRVWTKPQTKFVDGVEKNFWMSENSIRSKWRTNKETFVFWNKGSMWLCCSGGDQMTRFLKYNSELMDLAKRVVNSYPNIGSKPYNAVHVRRGGGHTRRDRRTAIDFYENHLKLFNNGLPLFVATDEKNREWFKDLKSTYGYDLVFFDSHEDAVSIASEYIRDAFPERMFNDALGFVEQIACCRAKRFQGSDGSTFSLAIAGMRRYKLC